MHPNTGKAFDGLGEDERQERLTRLCTGWLHAVDHPSEYVPRLDAHFSQSLHDISERQLGLLSVCITRISINVSTS